MQGGFENGRSAALMPPQRPNPREITDLPSVVGGSVVEAA
jgi:hypothetical protein